MDPIKALNSLCPKTLMETLEIVFTDCSPEHITAKMPVNPTVYQPYGLLHGGATIALAETVGSVLSASQLDPEKYMALGMQINATHFSSVSQGIVYATARFIKKGKSHHWVEIEVVDHNGKLINRCQLTNAIKAKK